MSLWPLLILVPAAVVTFTGRRVAWIWLSTGLALVAVAGALQVVTWHWVNGGDGGQLARLLQSDAADAAYHDTYYVVSYVHGLLTATVPCLIVGLLLLIPGHPPRAPRDIGLFWAAALLWAFVTLGPALLQGHLGMPRRFVDYTDQIARMVGWINLATLAAALVTAFAALRPVWIWLRCRIGAG